MWKPLLATIVLIACWLGVRAPAFAQQAPSLSADLIVVDAHQAAPASPTPALGLTTVAAADRSVRARPGTRLRLPRDRRERDAARPEPLLQPTQFEQKRRPTILLQQDVWRDATTGVDLNKPITARGNAPATHHSAALNAK